MKEWKSEKRRKNEDNLSLSVFSKMCLFIDCIQRFFYRSFIFFLVSSVSCAVAVVILLIQPSQRLVVYILHLARLQLKCEHILCVRWVWFVVYTMDIWLSSDTFSIIFFFCHCIVVVVVVGIINANKVRNAKFRYKIGIILV